MNLIISGIIHVCNKWHVLIGKVLIKSFLKFAAIAIFCICKCMVNLDLDSGLCISSF